MNKSFPGSKHSGMRDIQNASHISIVIFLVDLILYISSIK